MPNKTRKCFACKTPFLLKRMKKYPVGWIHSEDCMRGYVQRKQARARVREEKAVKKAHSAKKRAFYDNDVKTRKKGAYTWCHRYIVKRDEGLDCQCCGKPMDGAIHAGHFLESGNNSFLRYHEDNIHAQRGQCNFFHGGDSDDYEGRLRLKIGNDRVDYLLANKGGIVKRTAQDYKEIEDYYKAKYKGISDERD